MASKFCMEEKYSKQFNDISSKLKEWNIDENEENKIIQMKCDIDKVREILGDGYIIFKEDIEGYWKNLTNEKMQEEIKAEIKAKIEAEKKRIQLGYIENEWIKYLLQNGRKNILEKKRISVTSFEKIFIPDVFFNKLNKAIINIPFELLLNYRIQLAETWIEKKEIKGTELCNKIVGLEERLFRYIIENKVPYKRITTLDDLYVWFYNEKICYDEGYKKLPIKDSDIKCRLVEQKIFAEYLSGFECKWTCEKQARLTEYITGNRNRSIDIKWKIENDVEQMFLETFERYNFGRVFQRIYMNVLNRILGKNIQDIFIQNITPSYKNNTMYYVDDIRRNMKKNMDYVTCSIEAIHIIESSILKEVLIFILRNTTIPKKKRIDGNKNYFTYKYNDEVEANSRLKTFIDEGTYSNAEFSERFQLIYDMRVKLPYFERYMIEYKTGVYTSWRLYFCFYDILSIDKADKKISQYIYEITRNLSKIHSLEMRLCVIKLVSQEIESIKASNCMSVEVGLSVLNKEIKKLVENFNEFYDSIYRIVLYLYRNETNWKRLFGLMNAETGFYSELENDMIKFYEGNIECYEKMRFVELLYSVNKETETDKKYRWYSSIVENCCVNKKNWDLDILNNQ